MLFTVSTVKDSVPGRGRDASDPDRLQALQQAERHRGKHRAVGAPAGDLQAVVDFLAALDQERPLVVVRTPPEVSLYHRFENPLFRRVLERARPGLPIPT